MDELYKILEYLPIEYQIESDKNYFNKLSEAIFNNLEVKDYHFSLISLHILYMGIVYQYLYIIYQSMPTEFNFVLIGFHKKIDEGIKNSKYNELSWQSFSIIGESDIFEFYRSVGIKPDIIGNLKTPVKDRNGLAHAGGFYFESEEDFNKKTRIYLNCLEEIDKACFSNAKKLFSEFIKSMKANISDVEEAEGYLRWDFFRFSGINIPICRRLLKIKREEYPGKKENNKLLNSALKNFVNYY